MTALAHIQPLHVAAWIKELGRDVSAPTVKQRLAAVRHLFDWLVTGQVVAHNPAVSVRGPAHSVRRGKTPVLDPVEARALIDAIDVSTPIGLRDRALIGMMVYSFARIGAALACRVEDVFVQNRRLWVRLHEKRRNAGTRRADGQSRLHPYDAALRPSPRRRDAGRGGARHDLKYRFVDVST